MGKSSESTSQLFDVDKLENRPNSSTADFDDWIALDLSRDQKPPKSDDPYEFWNLKKGDVPLELVDQKLKAPAGEDKVKYEIPINLKSEPRLQPHVELDFNDEEDDEKETSHNILNDTPLVTHTLVDLYCGQGHIEKALEVLEKILILNPHDEKTIKKISEIKTLMAHEEVQYSATPDIELKAKVTKPHSPTHLEILQDVSEEDGRKNLMSIFDQQIKNVEIENIPEKKASPKKSTSKSSTKIDKNRLIEEKLSQFLKKIQKRALDYQARS
jgi:hypothetical protein